MCLEVYRTLFIFCKIHSTWYKQLRVARLAILEIKLMDAFKALEIDINCTFGLCTVISSMSWSYSILVTLDAL